MAKTEPLPGMEVLKIKVISDALEALREARKQRMDYGKKESEKQAAVLVLMHEHKIQVYRDDDFDPPLDARIVPGKEKVKVKLGSGEDEEKEED